MALARLAGALLVAEPDDLIAAAIQQHVLHVRRQFRPRRLDVEAVVTREGLDEMEVVIVTAVPAAHRTAGERQVRMHDDPLRIEELLYPKSIARRAGTGRVVE